MQARDKSVQAYEITFSQFSHGPSALGPKLNFTVKSIASLDQCVIQWMDNSQSTAGLASLAVIPWSQARDGRFPSEHLDRDGL